MARFLPRPTYANVVSSVCLILVLGGSAVAADSLTGAGSSSSPQIYVCVKKSGKTKGQMRVVAARTKCKKTERKTQWAVQGPAGASGPAGPVGPAGAAGASSGPPSGAVEFYDLAACPEGWSAYEPARGRYLVGLQQGGLLEGAVGSRLGDRENRPVGQHNHTVNDPGHRHRVLQASPILVGGNVTPSRVMGTTSSSQLTALPDNPAALQQALSDETTGISLGAAGSVAGTNAPYLQLLACKKD